MVPTDLSQLRASVLSTLTSVATIQVRTVTNDGAGNGVESYAGSVTSPCRIRYASGGRPASAKQRSGDEAQPQQLWIVTLPYEAVVNESDRLTIGGTTYEIVTANTVRSLDICQRFLVKRI